MAELQLDIFQRRRNRAASWIAENYALLASADAEHHNTTALLACLAHWGDAGCVTPVSELLARYPQNTRSCLPVVDYLSVLLAEASPEGLDLAISIAAAAAEQEALAMAHLAKAQVLQSGGQVDAALAHSAEARHIATALGFEPFAAVAKALEALLHLEKDRLPRALDLLRESDIALAETEDWLWQARVKAGLGRIALMEGRYEHALEHFEKSTELLSGLNASSWDVARAQLCYARAERLNAARIADRIDATARLRRRSPALQRSAEPDRAARDRVEQLRRTAQARLARAASAFRELGDSAGMAQTQIERGYVRVDCGDLDHAARDASEAFAAGSRAKNALTMAEASLLHSRIENTRHDEGIGRDITRHAHRALDFARDSLRYVGDLGTTASAERRVLAGAHLAQGLLLSSACFNDMEAARECCHRAGEYLSPANRDELWEAYQTLAARVRRSGSIDDKLRKWSQGLVDDKTFQQMTEEFAALVIPRVWTREGRNVSRVVAKLSISPKKVRRILTRAGLKE